MGCPAMEFIEEDIRDRLLLEPDVDTVRIDVVWDPVWTRSRIREDARARMREPGDRRREQAHRGDHDGGLGGLRPHRTMRSHCITSGP